MPLSAGGFNHRAEAFYRCVEERPDHALVQDALHRGLRKVKVLNSRTPDHVFSKVIALLNQFHTGSGDNHFDVLNEALKIEQAWKAECAVSKLNSYNPKYTQLYEHFALAKSASAEYNGYFKAKNPYWVSIALVHHLQVYGVYAKLEAWSNECVDYLDPRYEPLACIHQMHALASLVVSSQKKFTSKEKVGVILFEALKTCVWP